MKIETLIQNAEKIKNKDNIKRTRIQIEIQRFKDLGFPEPYVILEKPTSVLVLSAAERRENLYLLSECIVNPDLSNKEAQKKFNVNNKIALLKKIFTEEEIDDLINHLGRLNLTQNRAVLVGEVKN